MSKLYEFICDKDTRKKYEQSFIDLMRPSLNSINVIPTINKPDLTEIIKKLKELNL